MKKLVIIVLALGLLIAPGCATINGFLCSPTPEQTQAADVGLALAQAALTAASVYVGGAVLSNLTTLAIPVFRNVIAGYCATQAEWDAAVAALEQVPAAKAMGEKSAAFSLLHSVKWDK